MCFVLCPSLLNNHGELSVTVLGNLSHLTGCQQCHRVYQQTHASCLWATKESQLQVQMEQSWASPDRQFHLSMILNALPPLSPPVFSISLPQPPMWPRLASNSIFSPRVMTWWSPRLHLPIAGTTGSEDHTWAPKHRAFQMMGRQLSHSSKNQLLYLPEWILVLLNRKSSCKR